MHFTREQKKCGISSYSDIVRIKWQSHGRELKTARTLVHLFNVNELPKPHRESFTIAGAR